MQLCALAFFILVMSDIACADDFIMEPPARELFSSPSGNHEFVIAMVGDPKDWIRSGSTGTLANKYNADSEVRWEKTLPHQYRPRFAVVNDAGHVVLLDQWINVAGPYAVVVLHTDGSVIAEYDFRAIAEAVGIQGGDIVRQAKYGAWMSTLPYFDPGRDFVSVGVGGKTIVINMSDGQLNVGH